MCIIIFSKLAIAFKTSNICVKSEDTCMKKINTNSYISSTCRPPKCFGNYSFECGPNHCSSDKKHCEFYRSIKSNLLRLLLSPSMYQIQLRRFEKELELIKACPLSGYKFSKKDVCLKNSNCFLQIEFPHTVKKKIDCPCDKQHSYLCMKRYCVTNKKACTALEVNLKKK